MKQFAYRMTTALIFSLLVCSAAQAGPDRFKGDSNIYSGGSTFVPPNIMIIINNSNNMADQTAGSEPYDGTIEYTGPYKRYGVYFRNNPTSPWQLKVDTVDGTKDGAYKVSCADTIVTNPDSTTTNLLLENGFWKGGLDGAGACSNKNNDQKDFYLGNLINKLEQPPPIAEWTADTVYAAGDLVHPVGNDTVSYRATFNSLDASKKSCATEPTWAADPTQPTNDCGIKWFKTGSIFETTKKVLAQVITTLRKDIHVGIMTFGNNNDGGAIRTEVKTTRPYHAIQYQQYDGEDHYKEIMALLQEEGTSTSVTFSDSSSATVDGLEPIASNTHEPVASAMFDAGLYFKGEGSSNTRVGQDIPGNSLPSPIPSPIDYECQKNFVIVLTTGASNPTAPAENAITDQNGDGIVGPRDAAYLLFNTDHSNLDGDQRVQTSIIQFLTESQDLKEAASAAYGNGDYVMASNTEDLETALRDMLLNFVRESDTAFVAPVVPASPENRTFSGERIYLGFFKPWSDKPWYGNLKKFGLNDNNDIVSTDGSLATKSTGDFEEHARSYWNDVNDPDDSGNVELGGVGARLKKRTAARNIYTFLGNTNLTDSTNAFNPTNITAAMLALPDASLQLSTAAAPQLVNFVRGADSFDDDGKPSTARRDWLLGDILHSRPLVVNYASYDFSATNEANCSLNKTYIFVGANDGMLHAFRDCDGEEAWAFVPPDLIEDLKYLRNPAHSYFVDSSPVIYIHDANNDLVIDGNDGDLALMLVMTRRGRGHDRMLSITEPRGSLYVLNVTDPASPVFVGRIDVDKADSTGGFPYELLGEMWSTPRLAKVKVTDGGTDKVKIVAIFGGGYDNAEDYRWGNTLYYPLGYGDHDSLYKPAMPRIVKDFEEGSSYMVGSTPDLGPLGYAKNLKTTTAPYSAQGLATGVYVVEIATLATSVDTTTGRTIYSPDTTKLGDVIWKYNRLDSSIMRYSIASDVAIMDTDVNGYTDRIYVGDVAGQLWRFNIGDLSTGNWSAKLLFRAWPYGSLANVGRKIFHRPEVVPLNNQTMLIYFGTGDRAHPLNYLNPGTDGGAVIDRIYMVRDTDNDNNPSKPSVIYETHLLDLTTNPLQREDTSAADKALLFNQLYDYYYDGNESYDLKYGWYVNLNYDSGSDIYAKHWGEKVLSSPAVFGGKLFVTTYQPKPYDPNANPCDAGNLGKARLYAMDYRTSEAVYNFYTGTGTDNYGEDQSSANNDNAVGKDAAGNEYVLRRADRELDMGGGIPNTPVFIVNENGEVDLFTPADRKFVKVDLGGTGMVYPVFWMQW